MKSKRFTTLIAIFVISLLACAFTFGVSVFAEETVVNDVSDYFNVPEGVEAKFEGNDIVFTIPSDFEVENDETATGDEENKADENKEKDKVVIESKYDFDLPNVDVDIPDEDVLGGTVTTNAGEEAGKLVITFTFDKDEATTEQKFTIKGIKVGGKALYTITDDVVLTPDEDAITIGKLSLAEVKAVVWGYNYKNVSFGVYHGFITDLGSREKQLLIAYGKDAADCANNKEAYVGGTATDDATFVEKYDFTTGSIASVTVGSYTGNTFKDGNYASISLYWGLKDKPYSEKQDVNVVKELDEAKAPAYDEDFVAKFIESGKYEEYNTEVANGAFKKVDGKVTSEYYYLSASYTVPTGIYEYLVSDYFVSADLTPVVYYKLPESDSFTKLSSTSATKKFTLSKIGYYDFYVVATDPMNNEFTVDEDWELTTKTVGGIQVKGFYNGDNLMVPVFSFYLGNSKPDVSYNGPTVSDKKGFVGASYTALDTFSVEGNDVTTTYTLWYHESEEASTISDKDANWKSISTLDEFKEVFDGKIDSDDMESEFASLAWNNSSLTFTPVMKGSYAVKCEVVDVMANPDEAYSSIVNVKDKMEAVKINTTYIWFENNWQSVLFLGIAVLSLIGIIVLLFVKPKEEKEIEVVEKK